MSGADDIIVEGMSRTATNNLTDTTTIQQETHRHQTFEQDRLRRQAEVARIGPATLDFLQKSQNAWQIANQPKEWENLGVLEKLYASWRVSAADTDLAAAARDAVDTAQVPDRFSDLDLTDEEREHAAETGLSDVMRRANQLAKDGEWGDKKRAEHIQRTWEFAEAARRKREYTTPKIMEELAAEKTFGGAFNKFMEDPLNLMAFVGTSSLAGQWQYILGAMPAYMVGGPLAGAAVTGAGSYRLDRAAGLLQGLSEAGIDLTDSEAVRAYLRDPSNVQRMVESANKHAQAVAAFDFLAGLVAPMEISAFARAAGTARSVRNAMRGRPGALSMGRMNRTTEAVRRAMGTGWRKTDELLSTAGAGAVLGAAGEAAGQINAGQDLNWGDILAEAIGEYFTLPVEAVSARVGMSLQNYKQLKKAQFAARTAEVFPKIVEAAKLSVLRANDPNAFHQLVKNMGESAGARDVYVSNQDLRQTDGLIDALKAAVPTLAPKIDEAVRTGGDLTIPLADLTTDAVTSNSGLVNALKPVVRIDPDGMSYREAEAFVNSEEMQKFGYAYVEEATRKKMLDTAFSNELDEVMAPIEKQFMAARSAEQTPDMVRASMRPYRAALGHMAALAGMSPKEFAARFPMSVVRVADAASRAGSPVERDSKTGEALMQGVPAKSVDAVRKQYEGTDAWMKAPNGQPTKLTETQWLQVRTPEFKAWFGDWEAAYFTRGWSDVADPKGFLGMPAIELSQDELEPVQDKNGIVSVFRSFGDVKNKTDGTVVVFPANAAGRMVYKRKYVRAFKKLFESARLGWTEPETKFVGHKDHDNIVGYRHYINKFATEDGSFYVRFTVRKSKGETKDGHIHAAVITNVEIYENKNGTTTTGYSDRWEAPLMPQGAKAPFVDRKLANFFNEVNRQSVSKIVDENGEPLVVYHVTDSDFNTFDLSKARQSSDIPAFFFSSGTEDWAAMGSRVVPVFLNIRNPTEKPIARGDGAAAREQLIKEGYDGTIEAEDGMETEYAALYPEQIKSATGNNGNFDPRDANIYHQEVVAAPGADQGAGYKTWRPTPAKGGGYKGGPEWVKNAANLGKMRKVLRQLVMEGISGRFWYEDSAKEVWEIVGHDLKRADMFCQLLAIYSPRSNIWVNSLQAVRAYTHWASGMPAESFDVGSGDQDSKAIAVLYKGEDWDGRKTGSFYTNLMYELIKGREDEAKALGIDVDDIRSGRSTTDMWVMRAFGYANEETRDDKGSGMYSFTENETRRLTALLNEKLKPGEEPWTPHQVQAAMWTALKTRYEIDEVKANTNKKSTEEGILRKKRVNGKEEYDYEGQTPDERRQHHANWREFAMEPDSATVTKLAEEMGRDFSDELIRQTQTVTAEAIPSSALGQEINDASEAVRRMFTDEAMKVFVDGNGKNLIAEALGIPLNYSSASNGAYDASVSPNQLLNIIPFRPKDVKAGKDQVVWEAPEGFDRTRVRMYARVLQYIFKQDAVPFFRLENKPLVKNEEQAQKFRVINANGRAVRTFETESEARAFMAKQPKKQYTLRGGKLAKAFVIRFDHELSSENLKVILDKIAVALGESRIGEKNPAGFTQTDRNEITVVNFRDDDTGIPRNWSDEDFVKAIHSLDLTDDGAASWFEAWSDGEYGYWHDWGADPDGSRVLQLIGESRGDIARDIRTAETTGDGRVQASPTRKTGPSDEQLARWRADYEGLLRKYSGDSLKRLEAAVNRGRRPIPTAEIERQSARAEGLVLNQPAYHGTQHEVDEFSTDYIGTGEGAQAHGWGMYFSLSRDVAHQYRLALTDPFDNRVFDAETGRELKLTSNGGTGNDGALFALGRRWRNTDETFREEVLPKETVKRLAEEAIQSREKTIAQHEKAIADHVGNADFWRGRIESLRDRIAAYREIAKNPPSLRVAKGEQGHVYKVDIPEDTEMLHEQLTMSQQPEKVQRALEGIRAKFGLADQDMTGKELYKALVEKTGSPKAASLALLDAGIKGIRYDGKQDGPCAVVFSGEAVRILEFEQQQALGNRGSFDTSTGLMSIFSAADASTFIHESGHYFFNALGDLASEIILRPAGERTAGESELVSMMGGFLKWCKVEGATDEDRIRAYITSGPEERRRVHEQFARGYEAYTREGEAPTSALKNIFNKFKEWLMRVYRDASELNVEMSDEVRDLYARMFRSEAEAAALREEAQMKALFPDAQSGGLSEEEWKALNSFYAEAAQAVEAAVRANRERNYKILRNKEERVKRGIQQDWENIENEVAAEVDAQPERQAERVLSSGMQTADGETVRFKLWTPDLASLNLPPQAVQALEEKGYTVRDRGQTPIVTPRLLADMLGAPDAVMLLTNLASLPDRDQVIQEQTEQKFFEKHGDFPDEDGINSLARERIALHSDAYSKALAAEYRALQRLAKIPSALKQMTREVAARFAKQAVGRTQVRNLKPLINERAEAAAGREARAALGKSDFAGALDAKRRQILQHYLSKEGEQARAEIAKALARVKRVLKSKTIHGSFMEQLENLAARFKLAPSLDVNKQSQSLAEFVEAQQENGYFFEFDELVTSGVELPYQALTIEQFREVMSAFDQLAHVGREMQNLTINGQQVSTRDAVAEAREILKANAADRGREPHYDWDREKPSAGAGLFRFLRNHVKVSTWCRIFDGAERGGFWWNLFSRRANACGDRETQLRGELTQTMTQILSGILSKYDMDEVVAHTNITLTDQRTGQLTNVPREITRDNRLALALNWGNDGNRQRIRAGFGLTDTEVERILYGMSAEEWQAVEAIWKTFEALRPELEALEKRIYGRAPNWVEYTPFEVQIGPNQTMTVSGGYYPIMYDKNVNSLADSRDAAKDAEVMMRNAFEAVRTDRSHMKARAAKNNQPVSLRFTGVFDALNNEVHDLCWREFVIDAERLLRGGLKDTIRDYYSADVARIFQNWVRDLAVGDKRARGVEGEQWSSWLRQGVGLAGLGFNITSAIAQLTGILATASHLGTATLRGVAIYSRNPIAATREACEESLFMKNRSKTRFRELNEVANRIRGQSETLEKVHRGAYFLLLKVQQIVDTVTWHAAYAQAAEQGRTHEEAVAMADQAVLDTQGGGELKDLSQIERGGPISKLFTVFYSFMNTAFNLNAGAYLGEKNRYKAAARILTLSVIMPVLEQMIRAALPAGGDDDDDEDPQKKTVKMLRKAAGDIVDFNLGTLMVAREVSNVLGNAIAGEPIFGYKGPAGTRVIGDFVGTVQQVSQGEFDAALVKSLINLSGDLFGLPSAQINRAISTTQAVEEGKIEGPAEIARGALFGVRR